MSILKVDSIKNRFNANQSLTINSSGIVFSTVDQRPAFYVRGIIDVSTSAQSESRTARYGTEIVFNRGNHYSPETGYFTAPFNGFYHFNYHHFAFNSGAPSTRHYSVLADLIEITVEQPTAGVGNGFANLGASVNVELNAGDRIRVATTAGSYTGNIYGHFSGFFMG